MGALEMDNKEKESSNEDDRVRNLRQQILTLMRDESISQEEKTRRTQMLMSGGERRTLQISPTVLPKEVPSYADTEKMIFGCKHYQRSCKVKAACCGEWFTCRLCHADLIDDHEMDRKESELMLCMSCLTEQPIAQYCANCNLCMGAYFCGVCRLWDSTPEKQIYHCDECGICRRGKREDYIHCNICKMCLHQSITTTHKCLQDSLNRDCPICCEYLFTSVKSVNILRCGHPMHAKCANSLLESSSMIPRCPMCFKCISENWLKNLTDVLDFEVNAQPMPEEVKKDVTILCYECNQTSVVPLHFIAMKCPKCSHYNTAQK